MWTLAEKEISSRLLVGTANYPSLAVMQQAIHASETSVITVSMKRQLQQKSSDNRFWETLNAMGCHLLPNTAGCHDAKTAVTTAEIARELFNTHWIKLEVIGDDYTLQPDPIELITATRMLISRGFEVFPYCTEDLVLCQKLVDCGCRILMPWAAPIGSGKGILNPYALAVLRERLPEITLIIDAGIGKPSHAVQLMEMGMDAVLLNTAIAGATHPIEMAQAFRHAVIAGRSAYTAGIMSERNTASPSTALLDTPFWLQSTSS